MGISRSTQQILVWLAVVVSLALLQPGCGNVLAL